MVPPEKESDVDTDIIEPAIGGDLAEYSSKSISLAEAKARAEKEQTSEVKAVYMNE